MKFILKFAFPFILFCSSLLGYAQSEKEIGIANEYYGQGELEKARAMYDDLAKNQENIPFIHDTYMELLISQQDYKEAEKYLNKLIRSRANGERYQIDLAQLYEMKGDTKKAEKLYEEIIDNAAVNNYKTNLVAQLFFSKRMYEKAVNTYLKGRQVQKSDPSLYAVQIANLYQILGEKDKMLNEYFLYIDKNPQNLNYVKNMLQNALTEQADMVAFEQVLFDKVQKEPDNLNLSELLIWVNLQQKNFYGAFIQARAIEKRLKSNGNRIVDIGIIALDNKDYESAIKVFDYVTKEFKDGPNYYVARRYVIKAREELVKNTYPVDKSEILKLVNDYQQLVNDIGINTTTLEALTSKALLHAFYLDQKDSAIAILHQVIGTPGVSSKLKAQSKLALGDIYLLIGEPWEATLLYSQVEKTNKEEPLGYEAKLKNAKLSYYKGEFGLAQGHLDILKEATTREIANDAMALSQLIKNNNFLDTTDIALKTYADIELMLFQNQKEKALQALDKMLIDFPKHSLTDEILFLQAKIYLELGNFNTAVEKLSKVVENWRSDILSDDSYFLRTKIYDEYLKDKEKAMEGYREFMTKYPGSVYVAEARKRFRILRGDFPN